MVLLKRTEKLPEGPDWFVELDGYRALAIKTGGKVHLRSRNDNDFTARYPRVVKGLGANSGRTHTLPPLKITPIALDESFINFPVLRNLFDRATG